MDTDPETSETRLIACRRAILVRQGHVLIGPIHKNGLNNHLKGTTARDPAAAPSISQSSGPPGKRRPYPSQRIPDRGCSLYAIPSLDPLPYGAIWCGQCSSTVRKTSKGKTVVMPRRRGSRGRATSQGHCVVLWASPINRHRASTTPMKFLAVLLLGEFPRRWGGEASHDEKKSINDKQCTIQVIDRVSLEV